MNENVSISLELLFLNDLLRTNSIDKNIYDKAIQKINSFNKTNKTKMPAALATA